MVSGCRSVTMAGLAGSVPGTRGAGVSLAEWRTLLILLQSVSTLARS